MEKISTGKLDKNGITIYLGDIMTGLYQTGNPDGEVIEDGADFMVRDSDGDLLFLDEVIKNGGYVKQGQ